jgi:hypothetical protein
MASIMRKNRCNVVYALWRIAAGREVVLLVKQSRQRHTMLPGSSSFQLCGVSNELDANRINGGASAG